MTPETQDTLAIMPPRDVDTETGGSFLDWPNNDRQSNSPSQPRKPKQTKVT